MWAHLVERKPGESSDMRKDGLPAGPVSQFSAEEGSRVRPDKHFLDKTRPVHGQCAGERV